MTPDFFVVAFRNELMRMLTRLVPSHSACFYLVDRDLRAHSHSLLNFSYQALPAYVNEYWNLDPFHPRFYADTDLKIAGLDQARLRAGDRFTRYQAEFFRPHGIAHEVEVFVREQGRIVAGISLLRSPDEGPFSEADLALLNKVHDFVEYTVTQFYLSRLMDGEDEIANRYGLTGRQIDIVRMIRNGATNDEVARQLSIGLPTVKTHLQRLFSRLAVTSRTELVAKLYFNGDHLGSAFSSKALGIERLAAAMAQNVILSPDGRASAEAR